MPRPRSSGPMKKLRSAELTKVLLITISPPSGLSSPATQRSNVVLPEPLKTQQNKKLPFADLDGHAVNGAHRVSAGLVDFR